ncbi:G patch domain-containing protein 1 [Amphibalanus amphitrite]|uniref:G patch domain-containing protein 1 n=1 Tax=Amphibalanus amphitrite TaxID=1232801 RepID=A0A6A4W013_AMPAM|nr:G patch domain-containing protein 1 [Amphibalanus amphitrite]
MVYGCALPLGAESAAAAPSDSDSDSDSDSALREVLLAPDDFEAPLVRPKHDHMGLGYRGLDRHSVLGAAAGDTTLRYRDKAGKWPSEDSADRLARTLAGFRLSEGKRATRPRYPPPPLPPGFVPRHRARASRFEPRPEERRGLERHRLSAGRRAEMIGEQRPADPVGSSPAATRTETPTGAQSEAQPAAPVAAGLPGRPESERPSQPADSPAVKTEPGAVPADAERLRELHQLLAESGDSPAAAAPALKPFASDPEKQARYEKFLKLQAANRKEDYHPLLPAAMTDWERQREVSEFHRSALIFRPLAASLADKFVSAGTSDQEKPPAPGEATAGVDYPGGSQADVRLPDATDPGVAPGGAALSSIVGTLGLATGASSMSAPVLPTPTSAADAPAAPKPRLRWDDVLSDEEGGGTDTAAGGGGATAVVTERRLGDPAPTDRPAPDRARRSDSPTPTTGPDIYRPTDRPTDRLGD